MDSDELARKHTAFESMDAVLNTVPAVDNRLLDQGAGALLDEAGDPLLEEAA